MASQIVGPCQLSVKRGDSSLDRLAPCINSSMNKNNCRSGQCNLNVGKCNGTIEVGKPLRTEQSTAPEWRPVGHAGTCSAAACPREDGGAEATSERLFSMKEKVIGFQRFIWPLLAFSLQVSLGFSSVVDKHLDRVLFCLISCDTRISLDHLCHQ